MLNFQANHNNHKICVSCSKTGSRTHTHTNFYYAEKSILCKLILHTYTMDDNDGINTCKNDKLSTSGGFPLHSQFRKMHEYKKSATGGFILYFHFRRKPKY